MTSRVIGFVLAVWLTSGAGMAQHRKAPAGMFRDLDDAPRTLHFRSAISPRSISTCLPGLSNRLPSEPFRHSSALRRRANCRIAAEFPPNRQQRPRHRDARARELAGTRFVT